MKRAASGEWDSDLEDCHYAGLEVGAAAGPGH